MRLSVLLREWGEVESEHTFVFSHLSISRNTGRTPRKPMEVIARAGRWGDGSGCKTPLFICIYIALSFQKDMILLTSENKTT